MATRIRKKENEHETEKKEKVAKNLSIRKR